MTQLYLEGDSRIPDDPFTSQPGAAARIIPLTQDEKGKLHDNFAIQLGAEAPANAGGWREPGYRTVAWDGTDAPSPLPGSYFCRMEAGSQVRSRQLLCPGAGLICEAGSMRPLRRPGTREKRWSLRDCRWNCDTHNAYSVSTRWCALRATLSGTSRRALPRTRNQISPGPRPAASRPGARSHANEHPPSLSS